MLFVTLALLRISSQAAISEVCWARRPATEGEEEDEEEGEGEGDELATLTGFAL